MDFQTVVNTYPQSAIEKLLKHLDEQINQNDTVSETMDELVRYYSRRSVDGIDGLENKLNAAGMSHVYLDAIEKKEMFSKLLYRFSMYSTAQQIFVRFLAKAENEFNSVIYPEINNISESEIKNMLSLRDKARENKNYKEADRIRDELYDKGVLIEDKDGKTLWKFK